MGQILGRPGREIIAAAKAGLSDFKYKKYIDSMKDSFFKSEIINDTVTEAARSGHLHVLHIFDGFVLWNNISSRGPMNAAIKGGHLNCVEFLIDRGFNLCPYDIFYDSPLTNTKLIQFAYSHFRAKMKDDAARQLIYLMKYFDCKRRYTLMLMIDWRHQDTNNTFINIIQYYEFAAIEISFPIKHVIISMLTSKIKMRNAVRARFLKTSKSEESKSSGNHRECMARMVLGARQKGCTCSQAAFSKPCFTKWNRHGYAKTHS